MPDGKWTPFNDTHPIIKPKDLEKKKQHADYEIEAEIKEEEKNDASWKKLNWGDFGNQKN